MKCIDDEIPFEIPQSWCWVRLGAIATIIGGYAFPSESIKSEKGYRVIRISDFNDSKIVYNKVVRYNGDADLTQYEICERDILMAMTGGTVGKSVFLTELPEKHMLLNQRVAIIRNKYIFDEYLNLVITSPITIDVVNSRKNSTNDNISMVDIYNFLVPVPPTNEQKKIVQKIQEALPFVYTYGKSQEALDKLNAEIFDKLKKSVLQEAIQGKLVPQSPDDEPASVLLEKIKAEKAKLFKEGKLKKKDLVDSVIFKGEDNKYYEKIGSEVTCIDDEIPFEIPSNWQWVRLGKVTIVNPRNTISDEISVGFIPMTNISPGYGNSIECEQRYWKDVKSGFTHIAEGDVAFAKITPCFQNRKSFIAANLPNGYAAGTTELNVLRPYDNTIDTKYLLWFLKSEYFISEAKFKGTAGQQRVVTDYILNRLFPLPPVKEQIRISNHLEFVIASITRR